MSEKSAGSDHDERDQQDEVASDRDDPAATTDSDPVADPESPETAPVDTTEPVNDEKPETVSVDAEKASAAAANGHQGDTEVSIGAPPKAPTPAADEKADEPKELTRRQIILRRVSLAILGFFAFSILALLLAYALTPVPSSAQAGADAEGPVFYFSSGKELARTGIDRRPVSLKKVPKHVQAAVISAENRSFYEDPGVSLKGTARAFWSSVTGNSLQGGSTITQQMVRNYYAGLSQERTITRKLKEVMIALKVGRELSKDQILERYLNTIYFGREVYGIQAASLAYYNVDVDKLTPAQGAYLAAAIQLPNYFSNPTGSVRAPAEARWRYVLDGMVKAHTISAQDAAQMQFPVPVKQKTKQIYKGQIGYMVGQAKAELRARGYTTDQINRGGLKVMTTFDKDYMDAAEEAVKRLVPKGTSPKVLTGLTAVDPTTGEVKALYGGRDYLDQQYDTAFDSKVQAGSGFKPYVLAAALDDGYGLDTTVDGSSPQTFGGSKVNNDSEVSYGEINLVTATQRSVNTAYVNLGLKVGLKNVVAMAEKMGIPASQLQPHADAPTLSLGVASVSTAQQAGGFATFAAEGLHRKTHVIRQITDKKGVHKITEEPTRVLSTQVARDATYAMTRVVEAGTGTAAQLPDGRPVAGKTGTTDNGVTIWFNGFTPQLVASVAMFRDDNKPLDIPDYSSYGGELPALIWSAFMSEAMQGKTFKTFGTPSFTYEPAPPPRTPSPRPTPTTGPTGPTVPPTHEPSPSIPVTKPPSPRPLPPHKPRRGHH